MLTKEPGRIRRLLRSLGTATKILLILMLVFLIMFTLLAYSLVGVVKDAVSSIKEASPVINAASKFLENPSLTNMLSMPFPGNNEEILKHITKLGTSIGLSKEDAVNLGADIMTPITREEAVRILSFSGGPIDRDYLVGGARVMRYAMVSKDPQLKERVIMYFAPVNNLVTNSTRGFMQEVAQAAQNWGGPLRNLFISQQHQPTAPNNQNFLRIEDVTGQTGPT